MAILYWPDDHDHGIESNYRRRMMMDDPQIRAYNELSPAQYRRRHDAVSLAMLHTNKPCIGEPCDLDAPCKRHERTIEVVTRLQRMRDRHE